MVRPDRLELPTSSFVAKRSIQLSYGRTILVYHVDPNRSRDRQGAFAARV